MIEQDIPVHLLYGGPTAQRLHDPSRTFFKFHAKSVHFGEFWWAEDSHYWLHYMGSVPRALPQIF